jgi:N-dimethylarginine dimethylaminohydrolase
MSVPAIVRAEPTSAAVRFGGQSMTAPLKTVLVRRPAPPRGDDDWRRFDYLHPVDHDRTLREHDAFRATLTEAGAEVIDGGPDPDGELDAIFVFDPSIVTDRGAVVCRMGKPERLGEAENAIRTYERLGIPVIGQIDAPGTVEGGDTLWLDERTLAVGRGYRTNTAGIAQLAKILGPLGVTVIPVQLPHWRGPGECLHLMSLISPVADKLAVVYLPLMVTSFVEMLRDRDWRFVEVPDEEFDSMGCNVLALAPGRCLMLEGNPVTRRRLEDAGCEVLTYVGTEVSLNRAGGPTCLTKPIWREV